MFILHFKAIFHKAENENLKVLKQLVISPSPDLYAVFQKTQHELEQG